MKANVMAAQRDRSQPGRKADPLGANSEIGRKLRQYYDDLVSEAVPDKFAELLQRLEESQNAAARGGD